MSLRSEPTDPSAGARAGDALDNTTATCSQKVVSKKACDRLKAAREAIAYAKAQFPYGAGNQRGALDASSFNSYFRMQAARDNSAFSIPPQVADLAAKNPEAFQAAKAELAQGGNCGEHASVVYDYLRRNYPDENIRLSQKEGFDHAFVVIGDASKDAEHDLVVADAWPTAPTPVLWEDHFAYTSDMTELIRHASSTGDSRDYKQEMLDAGLALNDKGKAMVAKSLAKEETQARIVEGGGTWIWDHPDTHATGAHFQYVTDTPSATPCGAVDESACD